LGWLALAGLPFIVTVFFTSEFIRIFCIIAAVLLILPAFIYIYVIVIWHWKGRYRLEPPDSEIVCSSGIASSGE
jgi:hypothetical protein